VTPKVIGISSGNPNPGVVQGHFDCDNLKVTHFRGL
jgi:hypothetical protein